MANLTSLTHVSTVFGLDGFTDSSLSLQSL